MLLFRINKTQTELFPKKISHVCKDLASASSAADYTGILKFTGNNLVLSLYLECISLYSAELGFSNVQSTFVRNYIFYLILRFTLLYANRASLETIFIIFFRCVQCFWLMKRTASVGDWDKKVILRG